MLSECSVAWRHTCCSRKILYILRHKGTKERARTWDNTERSIVYTVEQLSVVLPCGRCFLLKYCLQHWIQNWNSNCWSKIRIKIIWDTIIISYILYTLMSRLLIDVNLCYFLIMFTIFLSKCIHLYRIHVYASYMFPLLLRSILVSVSFYIWYIYILYLSISY